MAFLDILKKAFPFLTVAASFVPGGNIATTALGQILKLKDGATLEDAGLALVNATPEQRLALQEEENRHEESLKQMGITSALQYEQIAAQDRASARTREMTVKDKVPAILAIGVTGGFFGILIGMFKYQPPTTAHDALMLMLGSLGTAWASVIGYYFGSSAGSAKKDDTIAGLSK